MKYLIKGEEYEFDFDWTLEEAFILKEKAFVTIAEFGQALQRLDPHAIAALAYVVLKRNRVAVKWDEVVRTYKVSDIVPVQEDVPEGGDEADPQKPPAPRATKASARSGGKSPRNAT
ncbi:hypothetical protein ABZ342_44555 [Amycolatopsis sp. NPDC005961]|uniref:hypothetical protein n=1 Tax=Amycolatopsis sp. NPDC005961 TaxID=3156720 RepID=UPI0033E97F38